MVVEVKTKVPWAAFPAYLYGGSRFGIMAQAQLDDKKTCDTQADRHRPVQVRELEPNQKLNGVRNPHYWQIAPDGKPYPYADSIEFRPIPDGAATAERPRERHDQRDAHLERDRHRQARSPSCGTTARST